MRRGGWRRLGQLGLVLGLLGLPACATTAPAGSPVTPTVQATRQDGDASHQASPARCPAARYRLPVVSQVTVPTTIVGGVLIPQHQTYVVLRPGAWRVVEPAAPGQPARPSGTPACRPSARGAR